MNWQESAMAAAHTNIEFDDLATRGFEDLVFTTSELLNH